MVYDAKWPNQNCTLAYYSTAIAIPHGSALILILILIKCMERFHFGFGRTECALVLVHIWIWMRHYILVWHDRNLLHTRLLFNYNGDDIHMTLHWFWFNIWHVMVFVLDEQEVRYNWCMFEFECVIVWYTITITHTPATEIHYNDNDLWLCVDVDWNMERYRVGIDCTASTLLLVYMWLWICHCWCTMHYDAIAIAYPPVIKYTTMAIAYGSALMSLEYMGRYPVDFKRTDGILFVLVHVWTLTCNYSGSCATTPPQIAQSSVIQRQWW